MAETRQKQRNLGRLSEIAQVAVRHGFGYVIEGHRAGGENVGGAEGITPRGHHLRELLDELGPTFVKFGQLLSTRPDIVPPDIISELRALQDDVRPFPFEDVERTIREDLGQPIHRLFLDFEEKPIAAASIGQVHRATLRTGARSSSRCSGRTRRARSRVTSSCWSRPRGWRRSACARSTSSTPASSSTSSPARSARSSTTASRRATPTPSTRTSRAIPHVTVPKVYWSYTRARVLTLEELKGVKLGDIEIEQWAPEQRRRLAYLVTETWMTMIFRHGFFHGDPHPANILVSRPIGSGSSISGSPGS